MRPFLGAVPITRRPILSCRSGESTVGCSHDDEDERPWPLGQAAPAPSCPIGPPPDPSNFPANLNCMRDARGNAVCSDGSHYPPGCPHTPPDQFFTPGVTPDVNNGGRIEGQIPSPKSAAGSAVSSLTSGAVPVAAGAAAILAVVGYFTFR